MAELNHRQQKFVQGVLAGKTHRRAYTDAGYVVASDEHADAAASRLLRNVKVSAAIAAANTRAAANADITAERVIDRMWLEATREGEGASHSARVRALELLGKRLRLFPDAFEHSGPAGQPIPVHIYLPANGRDPVTTAAPSANVTHRPAAAGAAGDLPLDRG